REGRRLLRLILATPILRGASLAVRQPRRDDEPERREHGEEEERLLHDATGATFDPTGAASRAWTKSSMRRFRATPQAIENMTTKTARNTSATTRFFSSSSMVTCSPPGGPRPRGYRRTSPGRPCRSGHRTRCPSPSGGRVPDGDR